MRLTALVLALGFMLGCSREISDPPVGVCAASLTSAVVITVNDSVSGASVVDSAQGVAQAGSYIDSLRLEGQPPHLFGGDRLGTYQIVIDRPGYREWTRSGVVVSQRGPCGNIISVDITALLQRAP